MADEPLPPPEPPATGPGHPAIIYLVSVVTACVLFGFIAVSYAALSGEAGKGIDAATKGSIIQTWNNMAVAVVTVWTAGRMIDRLKGAP